ncbi:hypothetical protein DSAG12_04160 [Promethearchaeum syntrophicum]|nr:hypothetical protein [Candidatus Prometheoarchaeum syntrophicum]
MTKNRWIPFISILIFISSNSIIGTAIYTYANNLGFVISIITLMNVIEDDISNPKFVGMTSIVGILIHTICGGFLIPAIILYYLFNSKNNKKKKRDLRIIMTFFFCFLILFSISSLPDILNSIGNKISSGVGDNIPNTNLGIQWDFSVDFENSLYYILFSGMKSYFHYWIFLYVFAIKRYKKYLPIILTLTFEVMIYYFLPITINGVWIRDIFSFYYPYFRYPFTVNFLWNFSIILGLESLYSIIKNIYRKLNERMVLDYRYNFATLMNNFKVEYFLIFFIIISTYNYIPYYNASQRFAILNRNSHIPIGYQECLLWTNYEIGNMNDVAIPNSLFSHSIEVLNRYYVATAVSLNLIKYNYSNDISSDLINSVDFIIIDKLNYNSNLKPKFTYVELEELFLSIDGNYYVLRITI